MTFPAKQDLLGATRGLLNIEDAFGVEVSSERFRKLTDDDFEFLRCAEGLFPVPKTDAIAEKTRRLCRRSLENASPIVGDASLKCHVAKSNLLRFNLEELWLDESGGIGVHLVHDFLRPEDLDEFKTFRDRVSFHHMSKFYEADPELGMGSRVSTVVEF